MAKWIVYETIERPVGAIEANNRDAAERIAATRYAKHNGVRIQSAISAQISQEQQAVIERNERLAAGGRP